jgi:hypothetical protein
VLPGYSSITDKHCRYITRLGPDFVRHISQTMPNVDPKVVQVKTRKRPIFPVYMWQGPFLFFIFPELFSQKGSSEAN